MIKSMQNAFLDNFNRYARLMPAIVLALPFGFSALVRGVIQDDWGESKPFLLLMLGSAALAMYILRNRGKAAEEAMFQQLRAKPSTIILRFSDQRIDAVTKQRYHERINKAFGLCLPIQASDETDNSDLQYEAAANALRIYANSHRDTEPRVYQELKEYHFSRNLYGGKWIAIIVYALVAAREVFLLKPSNLEQVVAGLGADYAVLGIMVASIAILLLFVTKKNVNHRSFDYAKTLIEVSERIDRDTV